MKLRLALVALVLVDFLVLTGWALVEVGYLGIFAIALQGPGGAQVFADLCVALALVAMGLFRDARARGLSPWPWLVGTVFLGSIAPLGYLLWRHVAAPAPAAAEA